MPSSKILEQKKQIVAELAEQIKNSPAGVLVNYQGITVTDDTKMRRALREAGVRYTVMKNSLTGRALEQVGYSDLKEHLVGMTAIAIAGDDPIAPAKIIKEYADKIKSFRILAGYLEGKAIDADTVIALANTPSREVLIAKFLGSIQSPLYSLAYVLQAIVDKNGGAEPAASSA
ncbi:MAG: 50S ribosomal protein L10 [Eubacteriales bacterium]